MRLGRLGFVFFPLTDESAYGFTDPIALGVHVVERLFDGAVLFVALDEFVYGCAYVFPGTLVTDKFRVITKQSTIEHSSKDTGTGPKLYRTNRAEVRK